MPSNAEDNGPKTRGLRYQTLEKLDAEKEAKKAAERGIDNSSDKVDICPPRWDFLRPLVQILGEWAFLVDVSRGVLPYAIPLVWAHIYDINTENAANTTPPAEKTYCRRNIPTARMIRSHSYTRRSGAPMQYYPRCNIPS